MKVEDEAEQMREYRQMSLNSQIGEHFEHDIDGLDRVYDRKGRLILDSDEEILGKFFFVRKTAFWFNPEIMPSQQKLPDYQTSLESYMEHLAVSDRSHMEKPGWDLMAMDYECGAPDSWAAKLYKTTTIYSNHVYDLFITNKRVILMRMPNPTRWMLSTGRFLNNPWMAKCYSVEKGAKELGARIYLEFPLDEITDVFVRNDCLMLCRMDGIGITKEVQVGSANLYQFKRLHDLVLGLDRFYVYYTPSGQKRFHDMLSKFNFGDVDGLGVVYQEDGSPILEEDEKIHYIEEITPFVFNDCKVKASWFKIYLFPRIRTNYEVIPPAKGTLYRTNKRLIFIRKPTKSDVRNVPFPKGTHIYFSFNPREANAGKRPSWLKRLDRFAEVYDFFFDDFRNHVTVLVPTKTEAAEKWYRKKVFDIREWPRSLLDKWYELSIKKSYVRRED